MPLLKYRDPADGEFKPLIGIGPTGPTGPAGPAGQGVLVLGMNDPVPPETPSNTVILRKET